MIRLTRSDPSRNMHRFYAMQLGNWVTNPTRRGCQSGTECGKKCTPLTATPQRALRAPSCFRGSRSVVV